MPKFYIQSGSLKLVTTAATDRSAAIWAVHRTLSQSLPFLSESPTAAAAPPQLAETVFVSQRGFDRRGSVAFDTAEFETLDIVTEWIQLLGAVDRLQRRLAAC